MERPSIKELMARMGHSTMDAAVRYLHATEEREVEIADGVGRRGARPQADDGAPIIQIASGGK